MALGRKMLPHPGQKRAGLPTKRFIPRTQRALHEGGDHKRLPLKPGFRAAHLAWMEGNLVGKAPSSWGDEEWG